MKESGFYNDDPNFIDFSDDEDQSDSENEASEDLDSESLPKIIKNRHTPERKSSRNITLSPHRKNKIDEEIKASE